MKHNRLWFKHDMDSAGDQKLATLLVDVGAVGYGIFWLVTERLYSEGNRLDVSPSALKILAHRFCADLETLKMTVAACESLGLWVRVGEVISSPRIQAELVLAVAQGAELSRIRAEAGKKGAEVSNRKQAERQKQQTPGLPQQTDQQKQRLPDLPQQSCSKTSIDRKIDREIDRESTRAREGTHTEEFSENQDEEIEETNTVLESQPNIVRTPEKSADFERAERQLIEATGSQDWEFENSFMLLGKRPLKKYSRIFLSVPELVSIQEKYRAAGVLDDLKTAAHLVDARLDEWDLKGKNYKNTNLYIWFISWALNDCIDQKEKRDRQNKYINNTNGNGKQQEPQRRSLPTAEETKNLIAGLVSLKTMQ